MANQKTPKKHNRPQKPAIPQKERSAHLNDARNPSEYQRCLASMTAGVKNPPPPSGDLPVYRIQWHRQKIDFKPHCAPLRLAFYRIQWRYQNFDP